MENNYDHIDDRADAEAFHNNRILLGYIKKGYKDDPIKRKRIIAAAKGLMAKSNRLFLEARKVDILRDAPQRKPIDFNSLGRKTIQLAHSDALEKARKHFYLLVKNGIMERDHFEDFFNLNFSLDHKSITPLDYKCTFSKTGIGLNLQFFTYLFWLKKKWHEKIENEEITVKEQYAMLLKDNFSCFQDREIHSITGTMSSHPKGIFHIKELRTWETL